jgi:hypothetical protein
MITMLVLAALYFLPTIIRAHRGYGAIGMFLLNFFFGWTGIGWLFLLMWALLSRPRWVYCGAPYGPLVIDRRW